MPSIEEKYDFRIKLSELVNKEKEKLTDDDVKELFALYKKEIINSENISNFCTVLKVAIEKGIATEEHINDIMTVCQNEKQDVVASVLETAINNDKFRDDNKEKIQGFIGQFFDSCKDPSISKQVIKVAIEKGIATEGHINDFIDASKDDQLLSYTADVLKTAIENEKFRKDAGEKTILNLIDKCINLCQPNSSYNECFIPVLEAAIKNGIAAEKYIESFMPLCTCCKKEFAKVLTAAIEQGVATEKHIKQYIVFCKTKDGEEGETIVSKRLADVTDVLEKAIESEKFRSIDNGAAIQRLISEFMAACTEKGRDENSQDQIKGDYADNVAKVLTAAIKQGVAISDHINKFIAACPDTKIEAVASVLKAAINNEKFRNDNSNVILKNIDKLIKLCIDNNELRKDNAYSSQTTNILTAAINQGMDVSNKIKDLLKKCKTFGEIGGYVSSIFRNVISSDNPNLKKDCVKNCIKKCIEKFIDVYTTRDPGIECEVEKLNEVLYIAIKYEICTEDEIGKIIAPNDNDNSSVLKRKIDVIYDMFTTSDYQKTIKEKINSFKNLLKPFIQTPNTDPEVLKAQISLIDTAIEKGILKDNDDKQIIKNFIQAPNTKC